MCKTADTNGCFDCQGGCKDSIVADATHWQTAIEPYTMSEYEKEGVLIVGRLLAHISSLEKEKEEAEKLVGRSLEINDQLQAERDDCRKRCKELEESLNAIACGTTDIAPPFRFAPKEALMKFASDLLAKGMG